MTPGDRASKARAVSLAARRTRVIVRLIESAPPLWERHRYAIAQALAETRAVEASDDPGDLGHPGSSAASTERQVEPITADAVEAAWRAYEEARAAWAAQVQP